MYLTQRNNVTLAGELNFTLIQKSEDWTRVRRQGGATEGDEQRLKEGR